MSAGNYSLPSRVFHSLALNRVIAEASFDIEARLYGRQPRADVDQRHVFISGLARGGTTVLLNQLYATGVFGSLTYRDMPFVLAPNLWHALSAGAQKENIERERAHGDGLAHGYDSPEALEEVFWRVFAGEDYHRADRLVPMQARTETLERFRRYVSLVLKRTGKTRYLSKNNNNILRLHSMGQAFPGATILIPFRDPLQHARSLREQHVNLRAQQERDPFVLKYMRWLGHHEFGADHRPFVFGSVDNVTGDPDSLDYWLRLWLDVYSHLLEHRPEQALFISYERLCGGSDDVWNRLCQHLGLKRDCRPNLLRSPRVTVVSCDNGALMNQAAEVHNRLLAGSLGNNA